MAGYQEALRRQEAGYLPQAGHRPVVSGRQEAESAVLSLRYRMADDLEEIPQPKVQTILSARQALEELAVFDFPIVWISESP